MKRRELLRAGAAAWLLSLPVSAGGIASTRRFVWINLRGALDALHAVVPVFDRQLVVHRGALVVPLEPNLRAIGEGFALHPALGTLHAWYREGCFAPVVAVATPYRERSHFTAQDVLESGQVPADADRGWLARAVAAQGGALAIARSVPVVLRGGGEARTWYPSDMPEADEDLHQRLLALYEGDAPLHTRLQEGLAMRERTANDARDAPHQSSFPALAERCGELLARDPTLRCAALECGGWDTHNAQLPRLDRKLAELDRGLERLRAALGAAWKDTVVVVATEFGRTVAVNGTAGTDHGTGSVLMLAGGALHGGRVLGEWPGLAVNELWQQRDLRPTSDLRAWLGALLGAHWQLDARVLQAVFPGVAPRTERLLRA
jgi:uncharacterized protein (DUF1501 family)